MEIKKNSTATFSSLRAVVLATVLIFHGGLVLRFRIVRLFPVEWLGYFTIGATYFLVSVCLLYAVRWGSKREAAFPLPRYASSNAFRSILNVTVIITIVLGLIWRYQVYQGTMIHSRMGDMLPLIDLATNTFLSGEFPYKVYELPWKVPLTYMPGLWMAYLPAQVFDFDLRHIGLLCSAFIMLLLSIAPKRRGTAELVIAAFVVVACFSLSPAIARFSINGHTYPLWLYISLFSLFMLCGNHKTATLFFGLMLATRQTSIIYLPFLLVFLWRQGGWRLVMGGFTLMSLICAIFCLPFALIDYKAFLLDPMAAYVQMAQWDFQRGEQSFVAKTIGFAYAIKTAGLLSDLSWLRYGLLAFLPALAWFFVKDVLSMLAAMGAVGIIFALLAPVSWYYIYVPPLLILSFAALAEPVSTRISAQGEEC